MGQLQRTCVGALGPIAGAAAPRLLHLGVPRRGARTRLSRRIHTSTPFELDGPGPAATLRGVPSGEPTLSNALAAQSASSAGMTGPVVTADSRVTGGELERMRGRACAPASAAGSGMIWRAGQGRGCRAASRLGSTALAWRRHGRRSRAGRGSGPGARRPDSFGLALAPMRVPPRRTRRCGRPATTPVWRP